MQYAMMLGTITLFIVLGQMIPELPFVKYGLVGLCGAMLFVIYIIVMQLIKIIKQLMEVLSGLKDSNMELRSELREIKEVLKWHNSPQP